MQRKILVVENNEISRGILRGILSREYDVIEAANGEEALSILHKRHKVISAVVLDILMPVMDGYEVLRRIRSNAILAQIPVIVATGSSEPGAEVTALSLGANDFTTKPYDSTLLLHSLRNAISLCETASILNAIQRDKLTGLYNRETFFAKATAMIQEQEPNFYIMACFDINQFRRINDQYGAAAGDQILQHIGQIARTGASTVKGISGRIWGDHFAMLYPAQDRVISFLSALLERDMTPPGLPVKLSFSVGRYIINDPSLAASAIYDRACIAKQTIKDRRDNRIAYFSDAMREQLLREQEIVGEMASALQRKQFSLWLQPKLDHDTNALIGAEVLLRWHHPQYACIMPAEFIPLFEQNGSIYELDQYVWEQTCILLRKWLDADSTPLPLSVNVSRCDLYAKDLLDVIGKLLRQYEIPPRLLHMEIAEAAFANASAACIETIRQLKALGVCVEIDNFGSGCSSLNMLKEIPADTLKLDMRFLQGGADRKRESSILEAVVRMAKGLGMSVIAECVETKEQAALLKSIGCNHAQGFLYAKPMPIEEYEQLIQRTAQEKKKAALEAIAYLDSAAFANSSCAKSLTGPHSGGGACIYEYQNGSIKLLRANESYPQDIGSEGMTLDDAMKLRWDAHLSAAQRDALDTALRHSIHTGGEVTEELLFRDLPGCPQTMLLRTTMKVLATFGDRYLVYCTHERSSSMRQPAPASRTPHEADAALRYFDEMPGGFLRLLQRGDAFEPVFFNEGLCSLLCISGDALKRVCEGVEPSDIHYDIANAIQSAIAQMHESGDTGGKYRIRQADGNVIWVMLFLRKTTDRDGNACYNLYFTDVTQQQTIALKREELLENLPCGAGIFEITDENIRVTYLNRRYKASLKREQENLDGDRMLEAVHPDDRLKLRQAITAALTSNREATCDLRILDGDGNYTPLRIVGNSIERIGKKDTVYATFTPISESEQTYSEMLPVALSAVIGSSPDACSVKDRNHRYICCNRAFAQSVGLAHEQEIVGKTDHDIQSQAIADQCYAQEDKLIQNGMARLDFETITPMPDGTIRHANTSKYPLLDSGGSVVGIYSVTRDTTQARKMDSQLQLLTESIPGGLATYVYTPRDVKILYFNDGFCELLGFTREEYAKKSANDPVSMVSPEDRPQLEKQLAALIRENKPMDITLRMQVNGGGFKWINQRGAVAEREGESVIINAVLFDVTKQHEAVERLRISEEEHRLAVQHSGSIICRFNAKERTVTMSPELAAAFSMPACMTEVPYGPVREQLISPDSADAYIQFYESILRGEKTGTGVFQKRTSSGWRWFEAHFSTIFSDEGVPISAVISYCDISEQLEKETVYKRWQQSLREKPAESYTLYRSNLSKDVPLGSNEGKLLRIVFSPEAKTFNECTAEYSSRYVHEEDRERFCALLNSHALLASFYRGKRTEALEFREIMPEDQLRWLRLSIELVQNLHSTDVEAYLMFEDIDERKRAELLTIERSETDPLTGLLNRLTFSTRVDQLFQAAEPDTQHALLMMDIDGFKQVNDVFGHSVGDEALIDIAHSLRSALRRGDLLGRLGGDEFIMLLNDIPNDAVIKTKAKQIGALVRKVFSVEVQISGSIGIAVYPRDGMDFDTLYKKADEALYFVKGSGKDSFAFHREEMEGEHLSFDMRALNPTGSTDLVNKRRMLIVDDSMMAHTMLHSIFQDDFIIEKAKDGNTALIRLRHYGSAISVVLLDLMMPGLDGFAVLERMQANAKLRSIPVIVVSGDGKRETSLRAIRSGASDYVSKPVDAELLRIRVQSAISKAENERLRTQNTFLELQNDELAKFRTVLEHTGTALIEHDPASGTFFYDPGIASILAGAWDERDLWRILLSDKVAKEASVNAMRKLVQAVAADKTRSMDSMRVHLRTPQGNSRSFRMNVYRRINEYHQSEKLVITFGTASPPPHLHA